MAHGARRRFWQHRKAEISKSRRSSFGAFVGGRVLKGCRRCEGTARLEQYRCNEEIGEDAQNILENGADGSAWVCGVEVHSAKSKRDNETGEDGGGDCRGEGEPEDHRHGVPQTNIPPAR